MHCCIMTKHGSENPWIIIVGAGIIGVLGLILYGISRRPNHVVQGGYPEQKPSSQAPIENPPEVGQYYETPLENIRPFVPPQRQEGEIKQKESVPSEGKLIAPEQVDKPMLKKDLRQNIQAPEPLYSRMNGLTGSSYKI